MNQQSAKLSWADLNQTQIGDVKAPPLLPIGHYASLIVGQYETGNSEKKGTPFVTFEVKLTEALGDVDAEELAAIEGSPFDKTREATYYLTANSLFILTDLAKALGGSDALTVMQAIEHIQTCGEPLAAQIIHEPNDRNPERPFVKIGGLVALREYEARVAQQSQSA